MGFSMVTAVQIQKYAWVVELLMKRKKLTLKEIQEEWLRSSLSEGDRNIHDRKTWYKCFEDIGMVYGIIIEVTPKTDNSKWYILNPEALRGRNVQQWMLACVVHRNLLEECLGMYNRVDIEDFPSENGMLHPITMAMKGNRKLEVVYQKYSYSKAKQHIVEPYFIKSYKQRFYVLCKISTGRFFTLSFDRILSAKVLSEHFNYPNDLFAHDFFMDSYGVMIPNDGAEAVDIVIRAKDDSRFYLKDKPLHHSQYVVRENEDYADFRIHIIPTEDFFGDIMQQGDRLEIMSPVDVRQHITERLQKALAPYLPA